ncbi:MAG TPA: hypothetical protein VKZ59_09195 [Acidobacteriota bacterium]|nr:hypothetical protein [Acidobacteriota bacterium]
MSRSAVEIHRLFPMLMLISVVAVNSWAFPAGQSTVDQVAAVIDQDVVTLSQLEWLIRYRGFQVPDDPQERRNFYLENLNRLLEQKLIAREAEQTPFIQITGQDIDEFIDRYRQRFESEEAFEANLNRMGMTLSDLRALVRRQIAVNRFVELRFEPFIIVLPNEIREYYEQQYVPQLKGNDQIIPDLQLVEEMIRQILVLEKTNQELDRWIANTRSKTRIEILLYRESSHSPNLPSELREDVEIQRLRFKAPASNRQ